MDAPLEFKPRAAPSLTSCGFSLHTSPMRERGPRGGVSLLRCSTFQAKLICQNSRDTSQKGQPRSAAPESSGGQRTGRPWRG